MLVCCGVEIKSKKNYIPAVEQHKRADPFDLVDLVGRVAKAFCLTRTHTHQPRYRHLRLTIASDVNGLVGIVSKLRNKLTDHWHWHWTGSFGLRSIEVINGRV